MSENDIYEYLDGVESLDDLLDIDNDVQVADEEEIDYEGVEHPHIAFRLKDFRHILKASSILMQGVSKFTEAGSVGFEVGDGCVNLYIGDGSNIFYNSRVELLNEDNFIEGFFTLNTGILSTVSPACNSVVLIYKKDNRYYIKLKGGDVEITYSDVEKDSIVMDTSSFNDYGEIDGSIFKDVVKHFHPLSSSSPSAIHRKVYFDGGAYVIFISGVFSYDGISTFPKFNIGLKEMTLSYCIFDYFREGTYRVKRSTGGQGSMIMFEGADFNLVFTYESKKISKFDEILSTLDNFHKSSKFNYVDSKQLFNIIKISMTLPYSLSITEYNYNDEGRVVCTMKTKLSDSVFVLNGEPLDDIKPLSKSASVQSLIIDSVVKNIKSDEGLGISLSDECIGFHSGNYRGAIFLNTEG